MRLASESGTAVVMLLSLGCGCAPSSRPAQRVACAQVVSPTVHDLQRVSTVAPFPRGLALVDGQLYVLCRGRVRGAGGVSAEVADQAGTIYVVDPDVGEPVARRAVGDAVRTNGRVYARATAPPFELWDRRATPPAADRRTDRPYCTLRYHAPTHSFYVCAFSGVDKPKQPGRVSFSKNLTDALLRYDRRTRRWLEVERHDLEAGGAYPHHDPAVRPPPHGWLNGPDNCLALGHWLYAVAKDNSCLVAYDLTSVVDDPEAGPPPSAVVLDAAVDIEGLGTCRYYGHSALAAHGGWLYVACRTSSVIFRVPVDTAGRLIRPIAGQLVARFEPFDARTLSSANITDMDFDDLGRLYVVSAQPARIHRFTPNATRVYDGCTTRPWADLAAMTANPSMKSENVLVDGRRVFVTSGDGYSYQDGACGTVYRLAIPD